MRERFLPRGLFSPFALLFLRELVHFGLGGVYDALGEGLEALKGFVSFSHEQPLPHVALGYKQQENYCIWV
jgi:hypothetical protein